MAAFVEPFLFSSKASLRGVTGLTGVTNINQSDASTINVAKNVNCVIVNSQEIVRETVLCVKLLEICVHGHQNP